MAHSRRQVWEKAKEYGLDQAISKISDAFGPGSIDGVMVLRDEGAYTTDDRLLFEPDRVKPGYRMNKSEVKDARKVEKSHLK